MEVICPNCQTPNRDKARFCSGCGQLMPATRVMPQAQPPPPAPTAGPAGATGLLPPMGILRNRYRILQKRAQGGMAAVYEALDLHLSGKRWAIKEMSDAAITNPLDRQRAVDAFQHEAQMLATLNHPNLPKVVDYFSEGGREYLVMEYVEGQNMEEMLATFGNRPLNEEQVLGWALQLCDVLDYLHHQNIIFRDLKPSNVMIERDGTVRLIDFGIARLFKVGKSTDTAAIGTKGYAPIEQYGTGQTDVRSDIYSLGATLHTLLTGFDPSQSPLQFPLVRQLNPSVSPEMEQAITTALAQKPEQRWQNITAMRSALLTSPTAKLHQPQQAGSAPRRSQPITTRLLAAVSHMSNQQLALLIGGLVVFFAIATAVVSPFLKSSVVWKYVPLYFLAGTAAWAASHRRGAAGITQTLVTALVYSISDGVSFAYLLGAFAGGLALEGAIAAGKYRRFDALWLSGAAMIGWAVQAGTIMLLDRQMPALETIIALLCAGLAGALGWFLGDLFWQARQMRQGKIP